jgi:hypothetical protein
MKNKKMKINKKMPEDNANVHLFDEFVNFLVKMCNFEVTLCVDRMTSRDVR